MEKTEDVPVLNEVVKLQEKVYNYEIKTNDDLDRVAGYLKLARGFIKDLEKVLDPIVSKAHAAHKEATAFRKKMMEKPEEISSKSSQAIKDYHTQKEKEQKELEERVNKDLAEKAEKAKQEHLKNAEVADNEWDQEIEKEKAAAIVPQTVISGPSDFKKQDGLSVKKVWKARVINIDLVPMEYCTKVADLGKLNAAAKEANKEVETKSIIPGIEFYDAGTVSVRS